MRERRWESQDAIGFDQVMALCARLRRKGLSIRELGQETALYLEAFPVDGLGEIRRLGSWVVEEVTLVETCEDWRGDFYLLAATHHELFHRTSSWEGYCSISHPWEIPRDVALEGHQREALFWIGFRKTDSFIRLRVTPREIITPGERRREAFRQRWIDERLAIFQAANRSMSLPVSFVKQEETFSILSMTGHFTVACSWPDAFGPCQMEFGSTDASGLWVPAAKLIAGSGRQPARLRVFLSGFQTETLETFHRLLPRSRLLYRGYVMGDLRSLPELLRIIGPSGRMIANLVEFQTATLLGSGGEAYAIIGLIAEASGYKVEIRLNRAPLPEGVMESWLEGLIRMPMVYVPFPGD